VFFLRRPSDDRVRAILCASAGAPFTYDAVGATRGTPPPGYTVDRYGVVLGRGPAVYERARAALEGFAMFPRGWISIVRAADGPIEPGLVFASVIHHLGFWSVNPGRVIDTLAGDPHRAGFAFGTIAGHAESGEESFEVSRDPASAEVRFDVVAFSRPVAPLARLGAPIARALQRRFAREACAAMRDAATGS
jgi:uncharacterized protein (UPF0548 family)